MGEIELMKEQIIEFEKAILIMENIKDSQSIERFKFTNQERSAIDFSIDCLKSILESIKQELK